MLPVIVSRGEVKRKMECVSAEHGRFSSVTVFHWPTETPVEEITVVRADDYVKWLRTEPLNQRRKKSEAKPYSEATVNRRIKRVRQITFRSGGRFWRWGVSLASGEAVNFIP